MRGGKISVFGGDWIGFGPKKRPRSPRAQFQEIKKFHEDTCQFADIYQHLAGADYTEKLGQLAFTRLIHPFPQQEELWTVPEAGTALLVKMLVLTKQYKDRVTALCRQDDGFQGLQAVLQDLLPNPCETDCLLICGLLTKLVDYVKNSGLPYREEVSPMSSCSEGSMPERTVWTSGSSGRPPGSPLRNGDPAEEPAEYADPEMVSMEPFFIEAVAKFQGSQAGRVMPPRQLRELAHTLIRQLEKAGYDYKRLTTMLTGASVITRSRLTHSLKQACEPCDSWGGFNLDFLVMTACEFVEQRRGALPYPGRGSLAHKRKLSEESSGMERNHEQPVVKKLRPDEEERWRKLELDIAADQLRGLLSFCNRIKQNFNMFAEMDDRRILLELWRLLDRKKLGLAVIRTKLNACATNEKKESVVDRAVKELFCEETQKRHKSKGQSDLDMHRSLFERFCGYILRPATLAEDLAPPVIVATPKDQPSEEPVWAETPESIQQVVVMLKERYKRLSRSYQLQARRDQENDQLHEHLFYSQTLRRIAANSDTPTKDTARMAADVMTHLDKHVASLRRLQAEYTTRKKSEDWRRGIAAAGGGVGMSKQQKLAVWLAQQLAIDQLPTAYATKSGLLVSIVQEHLDHSANCRPISDSVRGLAMELDTTNGLVELQEYIFHSYCEAACVMESVADLAGFSVDDIDIGRLSAAVRAVVDFLLEIGFNLYEAIRHYTEGRLAEVLGNMLRAYEGLRPEVVDHGLLTRLCLDFIDTKVKEYRSRSLPQSLAHWHALRRRVVALLRNGHLVRPDRIEAVKVDMRTNLPLSWHPAGLSHPPHSRNQSSLRK